MFHGYDTNKDTDHSYGQMYEGLFPKNVRGTVKNVLEFGVFKGGSLYAFRDAFPNAEIWGVDNQTESMIDDDRISTVLADIRTLGHDRWFGLDTVKYDLIVDDCSHFTPDIIGTFIKFWPFVAPNGFYVIEDLDFTGMNDHPRNNDGSVIRECLSWICQGGEISTYHGTKRADDAALIIHRKAE